MKIDKFKVEEWMNKYEASAKYDLTTTCIRPLTLRELGAKFYDSIFSIPMGYGDITGSERLKENIKSLYSNQKISNITVTHGAIGANQLVFMSLIEKGDEVVSIVPTYQQHYSIPKSFGANVKLYFLREEENWIPNVEDLSQLLSSKTKLLCLNNPNNPTGAVIPDDILNQIVELAAKNNVWILSDEVYRGLNLFGKPYSQSIADMYERGISVGSMSKTYSLPGLRVGWIASREDLINEINRHRQYNTISVSTLDDFYASVALENREDIAIRNFKIMREGLNTLMKWVAKEPLFKCVYPTGGTTALLRYDDERSSKEFCLDLQKAKSVAILPGETMEMEGYLRVGFCAENLGTALELLSDFIAGV